MLYYINSANQTGFAVSGCVNGPWTRLDQPVMKVSNPAIFVHAAATRLAVMRSRWLPCFRTRVAAKVSSSRNAMRVASLCADTSRSSSMVTASTETDFGAEQVKS